jgi:hypothetical protein
VTVAAPATAIGLLAGTPAFAAEFHVLGTTDLVKKKTTVLRTGKSYTARSKR